MSDDVKAFVDNKLYRIEGFLHPVDAMGIAAVGSAQSDLNVTGSMMEIGVFWGRSFALLSRFLRPEEFGVAADLFDIWARPGGTSKQLTTFRSTMRGLGFPDDRLIVLEGDSAEIDPADVVKQAGRIRLMSVDGGHEEHHVRNDIDIATNVINDGGVIIFDDFFNAQYPDVTLAVLSCLDSQLADYKPFLITRNKLYVTQGNWAKRYISTLENGKYWARTSLDRFKFRGHQVLFLDQKLLYRAIYQTCATWGLGRLADRLLPNSKGKFKR